MTQGRPSRTQGASPVQQSYIEVISWLVRDRGQARTCDIAERLGVRLPSVSEAVGRLAAEGLARRKSRHEIVLTTKGNAIARQLDGRERALHHFMTDTLGFEEGVAEALACKLEHVVDRRVVEGLLLLDAFMDVRGNEGFRQAWRRYRHSRAAARRLHAPIVGARTKKTKRRRTQ